MNPMNTKYNTSIEFILMHNEANSQQSTDLIFLQRQHYHHHHPHHNHKRHQPPIVTVIISM
ncbi:hypothetical protein DOY81_012313 [Sarcophaga bullata]|nr:hypothetical protein DOY81_012313 [Sarcophaga bullata]